jgi:hypothetical protein
MVFRKVVNKAVKKATVNVYRYKNIGANANASVIPTTWKSISPCVEIL